MGIETTKKLAYLAETKSLIKAALVEKGQAVSDTDTFRSYADKVLAIETGGGSVEGVHTVTFMSQDGTTVLYKRAVLDGNDCAEPVSRGLISAPTKESTVQYDYAFVGWATTANGAWDENSLKNVIEDKAVYAAYSSALRYYTITFYDDDGTTVLKTQRLTYGATPSYTPEKEGYAFDGWTPAISVVSGDASYTAKWTASLGSGTFSSGVTWFIDANGVMTVSGNGDMDDYPNQQSVPWANVRNKITTANIEAGVTSISSFAFYAATALTRLNVPGTVSIMGAYMVQGCNPNVFKTASFFPPSGSWEDMFNGVGYDGWYVGNSRGAKTTAISKDTFLNAPTATLLSNSTKWWCR